MSQDEIELPSWDHILLSDLAEVGPLTAQELQERGVPPQVPPVWIPHAVRSGFIESVADRYGITSTGRERLAAELGDDADGEIGVSVRLPHH